ncbi:MAG: hypothetical protein K2L94_00435, partial [Alphaproteobacteria bacterium]|nr:hypothetical protein [Alphaproteobacteria bacterium]
MPETKKMPGYDQKLAQDAAARRAQDDAAQAQQQWRQAAANAQQLLKLKKDKMAAIDNIVPPTQSEMRNFKARLGAIASGIKVAGICQLIFFTLGSAAHYFDVN